MLWFLMPIIDILKFGELVDEGISIYLTDGDINITISDNSPTTQVV